MSTKSYCVSLGSTPRKFSLMIAVGMTYSLVFLLGLLLVVLVIYNKCKRSSRVRTIPTTLTSTQDGKLEDDKNEEVLSLEKKGVVDISFQEN